MATAVRSSLFEDIPSPVVVNTAAVNAPLLKVQAAVEGAITTDGEGVKEADEGVKKFADIPNLHPSLKQALRNNFGYVDLSPVQSLVFSLPLERRNVDLFIRAKTGSGKTLAFLIPAVQAAIDLSSAREKGVKVLVVSPTRELAKQIGQEAERLCARVPYKTLVTVGGENRRANARALQYNQVDVLIGTPGRLKDLLEDESIPDIAASIKTLVLDEADTLLEMGFKKELDAILDQLPQQRRSLMVSATITPGIRSIASRTLKPSHMFLDCVESLDPDPIPRSIRQSYVFAPLEDHAALLRNLIVNHQKEKPNGRIMVFFPTTRSTVLYSQLFRNMGMSRLYELHSILSQNQRTYTSMRFRKDKQFAVLFTSDVSARGVDYPDISLVVQMGVAANREQYIHRVGRTGRAGKEGMSLAVLSKFEKGVLKEISALGAQESELQSVIDQGEFVGEAEREQVRRAARRVDFETVKDAHGAFLGYYAGRVDSLNFERHLLPKVAGDFAKAFMYPGEEESLKLSPMFLQKLGLNAPPPRRSSTPRRGFVERGRGRYGDDHEERGRGTGRGWGNSVKFERKDHDRVLDQRSFAPPSPRPRSATFQDYEDKEEEGKRFKHLKERTGSKSSPGRYEPRNAGTPEYFNERPSFDTGAESRQRRVAVKKSEGAWFNS